MSKLIRGKLEDIYAVQYKDSDEIRIFIKAVMEDKSIINLDLAPFETESMIEELNKMLRRFGNSLIPKARRIT